MITLTDSAKNKVLDLLSSNGLEENSFVRIAVKAGGCSGLSYDLSFDSVIGDGDEETLYKGFKVVTDVKSLLYIINMTLDFSDGINGKGFQFINPNATRTCGCGESFAI
jgi:iron-sulfur cluster assembly protein